MKQLSNAFIQALNDDGREYLAYATIQLMDGTAFHLTNEEIWSDGFRYEEAVSDDNSFTAIGSAIMGSATLIINNIYDDYTNYDFSNARVSLSMGITGTEDVLSIGEYKVDDTSYNGATIQLSLLDNMAEFDRPYSISTLAYPTTLGRIVYDACLNCGINAASSAINFPNGNFTVTTRPSDENVTFRDVISWAATIAGCFAKINVSGQLEFKRFDRGALGAININSPDFHPWEDEELYSSSGVHYLYSLTSQNICTDDVVITGITVRVKNEELEEAEESEVVESSDSNILSFSYNSSGYVPGELENDGSEYIILIENNSFITAENAETVVTSIGLDILGLRFRKLNISQVSDPSIEAGDVAIVTDRKLNSYKTLITRNVFAIGSSQTIVCGADTPSRSNSSTNPDVTKSYIEARKLFKKSMSAADDALDSAIIAAQAAHEAQASADSAHDSALSANNSANSALTQLSVVEDVAGTLRWISENGTFVVTQDTTVQPGTVYFIYENGEYVPITNPDTSKNPHEEGWYILDVTDSQASFIMAHLAVTNAGLWILPVDKLVAHELVDSNDNNIIDSDGNILIDWSKDDDHIQKAMGYKVLISAEETETHPVGVTIYNEEGTAIANYGETTTIGSALLRNVHIDNEAVYIKNGDDVLAKYGETIELGKNQDISIGTSNNGTITEGYYILDSNFRFTPSHVIQSVSSIQICGRDSSTNEYYQDYTIQSSDYTVVGHTVTINSPISGTTIIPDMAMITYSTSEEITQLRIGKNSSLLGAANYPIVVGNNNEEIDPSNVFSVSWNGNIRTNKNIYPNGSADYIGEIFNSGAFLSTTQYAGIDSYLNYARLGPLRSGTYIVEAKFAYLTSVNVTGYVAMRICVPTQLSDMPAATNVVFSARTFANVNSKYAAEIANTCIITIPDRANVYLVPSSHYDGTLDALIFKAIKIA